MRRRRQQPKKKHTTQDHLRRQKKQVKKGRVAEAGKRGGGRAHLEYREHGLRPRLLVRLREMVDEDRHDVGAVAEVTAVSVRDPFRCLLVQTLPELERGRGVHL